MVVVVDQDSESDIKFETGKTAGFDFGLKTFLTCSEGFKIESPLLLKQGLDSIRKANKALSRKQKGSKQREQARKHLCRLYEQISNQRRDWFWKLGACHLCKSPSSPSPFSLREKGSRIGSPSPPGRGI